MSLSEDTQVAKCAASSAPAVRVNANVRRSSDRSSVRRVNSAVGAISAVASALRQKVIAIADAAVAAISGPDADTPSTPTAVRKAFTAVIVRHRCARLTYMGGTEDVDGLALVAELARKSGLCWIGYGDPWGQHPVWHVWHDDAIGVVAGGDEQPLPGIEAYDEVAVTLRAKTTRHHLATCRARVDRVRPADDRWDNLTKALKASRLNLIAPTSAAQKWGRDAVVLRLVPLALVAAPGSLPESSGAAAPIASPATTLGPLPWVLHRRQTRRRPLS